MAAGEGDQVLVGLLDRAEPLAQVRHRPLFEGDHRRHRGARIRPRAVNFLLTLASQQHCREHTNESGGAFRHRRPKLQN